MSDKEQQQSINSKNNFGLFFVFADVLFVINSYYFVISLFYNDSLFISLEQLTLDGIMNSINIMSPCLNLAFNIF